jgi:preprotein translocase subunit Sec63
MANDHYAVLGLAYGATRDEIKKAHKKLALRCLPRPRLLARHPRMPGAVIEKVFI